MRGLCVVFPWMISVSGQPSLAARRARATSVRRLGVIAEFSVITLVASVAGVRVDTPVFALLVAWFAAAAGYALALHLMRTPSEANAGQTMAYCGDVVLLSLIFAVMGGAWWLGPAIHAVIIVIAFATIPRRFAGTVASVALASYLVLGVSGASGLLGDDPVLGIPSLAANADLALLVVSAGGLCLVIITVVLDTAIRWMRRTQERYRSLVQTAPDPIVATDRRGRVVSANEAALRLLGVAREELYGTPLRAVLPPDMDAAAGRNYRAALLGRSGSFLTDFAARDGRLYFDCSCTPIVEDGRIVGVLLIARDVTQARRDADALRASEEQLRYAQKMEAVGQLAGGIAHDFNNVLSVILGYSQFIRATFDDDDPRLDDVRAMESAAEGAASLTRQLLAFGRKQVVKPRHLDLSECLTDLGEMLKRTLGSDIEINTSFADGATVNADPVQIEQIVLNLALNSRDAMPDGGVLTIETRVVDLDDSYRRTHAGVSPGRYVSLSVTDTGTGMDRDTQARIFEPFFTTKPLGKGTGLGLPTVYGIVRQNGGHVWVYSEPRRGTTFRIYLPLDAAAEATTVLTMPDVRPGHGWETVLLVDDAERLRPLLVRALSDRGYNVIEARNGSEALELSREHIGPIHLLVTDLVMPCLSGPTLAKELMAERTDMRVLFMSGYAESAVAAGGRLLRGSAFIAKPFTPDVLAREVRVVLNSARLEVA
jgi:two-component system cell cycle sensor histidine kinase/response regulator CckA